MSPLGKTPSPRSRVRLLAPLILAGLCFFLVAADAGPDGSAAGENGWTPFELLTTTAFGWFEKATLVFSFLVAIVALVYTRLLVKKIYDADAGNEQMRDIADAVRQGADAYMYRQFKAVGLLVVVITAILVLSKWPWNADPSDHHRTEQIVTALGRGGAFLMGSLFSAAVGFVGARGGRGG